MQVTQPNPALAAWLKTRQSTLKIVKTTTTPSGQLLDWIPIESQVPGGTIASPPPALSASALTTDALRPVKVAALELDDPIVERGPAGTVPVVRPNLSKVAADVTMDNFLKKTGGLLVNRNRPNKKPTDPSAAGYFHCTDSQTTTAYGCDFALNVWDPTINDPAPSQDNDHSILQTWLQNYSKKTTQSVEGGLTVDQSLNGDSLPHIFIYYTTNGYSKDADNQGGYNTVHKGFVQYSNSVFPGARVNGASTFGGPQYYITMKFQLYKEPTNGQLNWWIAVNGVWMGYYPATLFNGGVGSSVEWIGFGGEVATGLSNPSLTKDQMGSGTQAEGGYGQAAFLRNLRNQSDMNGTMVNNNGSPTTDTPNGGASPYDIKSFINSGSSWGSYIYVGGPTPVPRPNATYNQITFTLGTGGDDLRGDSSATAKVVLPGGPQTFTLKAQSDPGWSNNSVNIRTFTIAGPAQPISAFGAITITLTSHNGIFQTDDNWNINTLSVAVSGAGGSDGLFTANGDPLVRLTGSKPSATFQPSV